MTFSGRSTQPGIDGHDAAEWLAAGSDPELELHLVKAIAHAAEFLPAQPPIRTFVHHNPLHAFEDLPFEHAVLKAARRFGTQPYESEEAFASHMASGRIQESDLVAVLATRSTDDRPELPDGLTRESFRLLRLRHLFEIPEGLALDWLLSEGAALRRLHPMVGRTARERLLGQNHDPQREEWVLRSLWELFSPLAPSQSTPEAALRWRDRLLAATGSDLDEWVHPLMIRLCAGFVDQGVAYWPMPERQSGILDAFRALYGRHAGPPDPWQHGLSESLERQAAEGWTAERTVIEMLQAMRIPPGEWEDYVAATLLSLRGWAGMIHQLEVRPDRAPVQAPRARLLDFLAVQLVLESHAIRYLQGVPFGQGVNTDPLERMSPTHAPDRKRAIAYEAFVLAQVAGLPPAVWTPSLAAAWLQEVQEFDALHRRRMLHLAYEHRHRVEVLDSLLAHQQLGTAPPARPRVQAIFCLDEREESIRRHLEEVFPEVETFGWAGFFGVAMTYQGIEDVRPTPLCPVAIRPRHLVVEEAIEAEAHADLARANRFIGSLQHSTRVGRQTLVRGSVLSATLGLLTVIPLIGRTLMPRISERLSHAYHHVAAKPRTRLKIERSESEGPGETGLLPGFTVSEMADVVAGMLRPMGIARNLAPLVLVVGHGSSSLNNPHEAAHDCGATGGGRGGPNARAFAAMANHPGVRAILRERGLAIPESSWFLGGYHDTCDDSMTYFDDDLVPEALRKELVALHRAFDEARRRDAHERCRRFESASLSLGLEAALAHAEAHAVDLGQPRPEYGHATNAVSVIGRREQSRGLFMDRRAFLVSYDPTADPDGAMLGPMLVALGPVLSGINLEYYFSFVDPTGYGCGTKLPHNIVGLLGVMDGHGSDLRTGLPWQMVEIHEPVRLVTVIETEPAVLERLMTAHSGFGQLAKNRWIQLVAWSPSTGEMSVLTDQGFRPYEPETTKLKTFPTSRECYGGHREHLPWARIEAGCRLGAAS